MAFHGRAYLAARLAIEPGIDLNPWSKQYADQATPAPPAIRFITGDIFRMAPSPAPDFIISSLFTHHLGDELLICFLQWMERHARHGWFINDLHRHPVPYYFFKRASRLLRLNEMVQHDGPISIARAFVKADWIKYLAAAQIPLNQVEIRWFFPFRIGIARRKP